MSFKFLQLIGARQREAAAGKKEKYLLLLKRAAFEDNLREDEALTLADLHAELGSGSLDEIAGEVREYKDLHAGAAALARAEKEHAKGTAALEAFDTDSVRMHSEHQAAIAAREADRVKLLDANWAALAKVEAAREAVERREAIEAKHWETIGVADPSIARQQRQEQAAAEELARPRTLGHATRPEDKPQPEITFEHVLTGVVSPAFLRGLTFARMDDEPEAEFRAMIDVLEQIVAGKIQPKNVRYLRKAGALCSLIRQYWEPLVLEADALLAEIEDRGMPEKLSGVVWALHPGQSPSDFRSLMTALDKARHGRARALAAEPDPFDAVRRGGQASRI